MIESFQGSLLTPTLIAAGFAVLFTYLESKKRLQSDESPNDISKRFVARRAGQHFGILLAINLFFSFDVPGRLLEYESINSLYVFLTTIPIELYLGLFMLGVIVDSALVHFDRRQPQWLFTVTILGTLIVGAYWVSMHYLSWIDVPLIPELLGVIIMAVIWLITVLTTLAFFRSVFPRGETTSDESQSSDSDKFGDEELVSDILEEE